MIARAKIKRTYQKHKEGYKIAIEHKLNLRLKPFYAYNLVHEEGYVYSTVLGQNAGPECFPLYIEVRYRGKTLFMTSYISIYIAPEYFDDFMKKPDVLIFMEFEKKAILASLKRAIENEGNGFNIFEWRDSYALLRVYSQIRMVMGNLIVDKLDKLLTRYDTKNFLDDIVSIACEDDEKVHVFDFLDMLKDFKVEAIYDLHKKYSEFYINIYEAISDKIEEQWRGNELCLRGNPMDIFLANELEEEAFYDLIEFYLPNNEKNKTKSIIKSFKKYMEKGLEDLRKKNDKK